jgi:hypothetical protein
MMGGAAPVESGAAEEVEAGTASVAGTELTPMTLIGGAAAASDVEVVVTEGSAAALVESPGVTDTELTPSTLTCRFIPKDFARLSRVGVAIFFKQVLSKECSTVNTLDTVRRTGPDAPGIYADAKNWVPAGNGSLGISTCPPSACAPLHGTARVYGLGAK